MIESDPAAPNPEPDQAGPDQAGPDPQPVSPKNPHTGGLVTLGLTLPLDAVGLYFHAQISKGSPASALILIFNLVAVGMVITGAVRAYRGQRRWGAVITWAWLAPVGMAVSWFVSLVLLVEHQTRF